MDIHHALFQLNRTRRNGLVIVVNYKRIFDKLYTYLWVDIHDKGYILRKLDTFQLFNESAFDI